MFCILPPPTPIVSLVQPPPPKPTPPPPPPPRHDQHSHNHHYYHPVRRSRLTLTADCPAATPSETPAPFASAPSERKTKKGAAAVRAEVIEKTRQNDKQLGKTLVCRIGTPGIYHMNVFTGLEERKKYLLHSIICTGQMKQNSRFRSGQVGSGRVGSAQIQPRKHALPHMDACRFVCCSRQSK